MRKPREVVYARKRFRRVTFRHKRQPWAAASSFCRGDPPWGGFHCCLLGATQGQAKGRLRNIPAEEIQRTLYLAVEPCGHAKGGRGEHEKGVSCMRKRDTFTRTYSQQGKWAKLWTQHDRLGETVHNSNKAASSEQKRNVKTAVLRLPNTAPCHEYPIKAKPLPTRRI